MTQTFYRVKDWEIHFENNRTRELKKLDWLPVPNRHDGDGFSELMEHENGVAHYGAWMLITQVASKCDFRGTLMRDGARPHDAASLARVTRGKTQFFEEALPRLVQIGWLEIIEVDTEELTEIPHRLATAPQSPAPRVRARALKRREGNEGNEGKGMEAKGTKGPQLLAAALTHQVASSVRFQENSGEVAGIVPEKTNGHDVEKVDDENIELLCRSVLGKEEMERCAKQWRRKAIDDREKLRRVLLTLRQEKAEGKEISNPGAYAQDLWKRFE